MIVSLNYFRRNILKKMKHRQKNGHVDKRKEKEPVTSKKSAITTISIIIALLSVLFIAWKPWVQRLFSILKYDEIETLASARDLSVYYQSTIECSEDYKVELTKFSDCVPRSCGRIVLDSIIEEHEADVLHNLAVKGLSLGGGSGGASIFDLHSGALSKNDSFINIKALPAYKKLFTQRELQVYRDTKLRILSVISKMFGVPESSLHLTHPTFFSRLDSRPAVTPHDEYWHPHIDKEQYESFHYTSLIYLTTFGEDFEGGRFIFIDKDGVNRTVEPRKGRISAFTSGSENVHHVEKVTSGTRYALTVAFSCDKKYAISDPT